jgi:hypothetical protein
MRGAELELVVVRQHWEDSTQLRALGRDVERGSRVRVRRGVYADAGQFAGLAPAERHLVQLRALDSVSAQRPVFSHWSAVVLHGLPFLVDRTAQVHTSVPLAGQRGIRGVHAHLFELGDEDVVERFGLLCTGLARTVVDVAGLAPFDEGVVVADAALRGGLVGSSEALRAAFDRAKPRRAAMRIGSVLDFADARSESPGESLSRVTMRRLGLPAPELQHPFYDADGLAGRVDFWFPRVRAAGEMDGRQKYLDPAMNGGDAAHVVYAEKLREDRIRALGVVVVRWGWAEARSAASLGRRLAAVGVLPTRLVRP